MVPLPLSSSLLTALETEIEELLSHLGRVLDFIGVRGSSLVGRLDDVPRCVRGVAGLGTRQGVATTMHVGELWTDYNLRGVIGPPSALPDEGLKEVLEFMTMQWVTLCIGCLWMILFVVLWT